MIPKVMKPSHHKIEEEEFKINCTFESADIADLVRWNRSFRLWLKEELMKRGKDPKRVDGCGCNGS